MDAGLEAAGVGGVPVDVRWIDAPTSFADTHFTSPVVIRAASDGAAVESFRNSVITGPVYVGDGVDLRTCDFTGAIGLEHLRLARAAFARRGGRFVVDGATGPVYRSLRIAASRSGLWQLADELHIGELDLARRRSPRWSARRGGLEFYRIVGGYGHRPSRPIAAWFVMVFAVAALLSNFPDHFVGHDYWVGNAYIDFPRWHQVLTKLIMRVALTPLSPVDPTRMHSDGFVLLLAVKLASVLLLVFVAMGLRSRLRR